MAGIWPVERPEATSQSSSELVEPLVEMRVWLSRVKARSLNMSLIAMVRTSRPVSSSQMEMDFPTPPEANHRPLGLTRATRVAWTVGSVRTVLPVSKFVMRISP